MTLFWLGPAGQAVSLEARYDRATVREAEVSFPLAPTGSRGAWNVAVRRAW